jgi:CBS domain-containing protein
MSNVNGASHRLPRIHPVLTTDTVQGDGTQRRRLRVFCDQRGTSVDLAVCRACPHCLTVEGASGFERTVRCTPPSIALESGPTAGGALRRGVIAVDGATLVDEIAQLFADRNVRVIVVTDAEGRIGGVVHESQLVEEIRRRIPSRERVNARQRWSQAAIERASAIMFPAAMIGEAVAVREAIDAMANGHLRHLLVVDDQHVPIGVLFDVDALHALHGSADPDPAEPR